MEALKQERVRDAQIQIPIQIQIQTQIQIQIEMTQATGIHREIQIQTANDKDKAAVIHTGGNTITDTNEKGSHKDEKRDGDDKSFWSTLS